MTLYETMARFSEIGYVTIGRGPKHPFLPNPLLAEQITSLLNEYPFLVQDQGYIDFVECYAGASMNHPAEALMVDIYGFTHASSHLIELPGSIVDDNGFLMFAGIYWRQDINDPRSLVELDFAFDATGSRVQGVYGYRVGGDNGYQWYCKSFLEWFDLLIVKKGRLL
jgi:hypothetical protein